MVGAYEFTGDAANISSRMSELLFAHNVAGDAGAITPLSARRQTREARGWSITRYAARTAIDEFKILFVKSTVCIAGNLFY